MDGVSLEESISDIEKPLIKQFREKTSDVQLDDLKKDQYVARWLKARSWDVDKAEKMFRAHLQWAKDVKVRYLSYQNLAYYIYAQDAFAVEHE